MRLRAEEGSVYRLVVSLDERDMVYGPRCFDGFSEAQSHVADAVRAAARVGDVRYVRLEKTEQIAAKDADWRETKRWNGPVIARVLAQGQPARNAPAANPATPLGPAPVPFQPTRPDTTPPPRLYRTNRWDFAALTAFVAISIGALAWIQFGSSDDPAWRAPKTSTVSLPFRADPPRPAADPARRAVSAEPAPPAGRRPTSR